MEISLPNQKTEIIGGKAFSYTYSDENKVSIERDSLYSLLVDMDSKYVNAGFLFGISKNGTVSFEKYVPEEGIIRGKTSVWSRIDIESSQLEHNAKEGYDSVMFVYTHPLFFKDNTINKISSNSLNYFDSMVAQNHKLLSAKLGFKNIYEGVLSIQPIKKEGSNKNRLFTLQAFDLYKGTNTAEGFNLNGNIKQKIHATDLLRKDFQTIKYMIDEISLSHLIMIGLPDNNIAYSSYTEKLNEMIRTIDLPNRVKKRITFIVNDQSNNDLQGMIVCLSIPPMAYNLHPRYYIEIINHIVSKIDNLNHR